MSRLLLCTRLGNWALIVGGLLALGGASAIFDAWRAARQDTDAIIKHFGDLADS
jgi:hypothetical protein